MSSLKTVHQHHQTVFSVEMFAQYIAGLSLSLQLICSESDEKVSEVILLFNLNKAAKELCTDVKLHMLCHKMTSAHRVHAGSQEFPLLPLLPCPPP